MKRWPICFALFAMLWGCGASPAPVDDASDVDADATPPAPEPEPAPPPQQPILRVEAEPDYRKCSIYEEDDGSRMVSSYDSDWFFYVTPQAEVTCNYTTGTALVADGALRIDVRILIPAPGSDAQIEAQLRERTARQLESEWAAHTADPIKFAPEKLGKSKRPALCVDATVTENNAPHRIAACLTSKRNINDEVVVHRAIWHGPAGEFDEAKTLRAVKEAAANWFLYSDTDGTGRILRRW